MQGSPYWSFGSPISVFGIRFQSLECKRVLGCQPGIWGHLGYYFIDWTDTLLWEPQGREIFQTGSGHVRHNYFSNDFKRRKAWSLIISISPATVDISNKLESVNKWMQGLDNKDIEDRSTSTNAEKRDGQLPARTIYIFHSKLHFPSC